MGYFRVCGPRRLKCNLTLRSVRAFGATGDELSCNKVLSLKMDVPCAGLLFFELLFLSFRTMFTALFTFPEEFKVPLPLPNSPNNCCMVFIMSAVRNPIFAMGTLHVF
jgi:hypothetical protein